jgi:hypothetical protein
VRRDALMTRNPASPGFVLFCPVCAMVTFKFLFFIFCFYKN